MDRGRWLGLAVVAVAVAAVSIYARATVRPRSHAMPTNPSPPPSLPVPVEPERPPPPRAATGDNLSAAAYVGPAACARCHPDNAARWRASLHATMTQAATGALRGDFADARLRYAGGTARFTRGAAGPEMILTGADRRVRRYRVTRTIGSRGLQEYVGIADDDPAPIGEVADALASTLGVAPPPRVPVESVAPEVAGMLTADRKIANGRMKQELGVVLRYPSWRSAIR